MSCALRILTFNWHEPYICLLAKTGHAFDVAEPSGGRAGVHRWDGRVRPKPENVTVTGMDDAIKGLKENLHDLVICHNFRDLKNVAEYSTPAVLTFHNKLAAELAIGGGTVSREDYLAGVAPLAGRAEALVFVSEGKREDWSFGRGRVIKPCVDIDDLIPYGGEEKKILRVGNLMKERDMMLGYNLQEAICEGFPHTLAGDNPSIESSRPAEGWDELKSMYASHRIYLNTTLFPYEDGYNLAMLEAMGSGAPVVSWSNPTSPIENGVNGFVSKDIDAIRAALSGLMGNRNFAAKIGEQGRETVRWKFSVDEFVKAWDAVFGDVLGKKGESSESGGITA